MTVVLVVRILHTGPGVVEIFGVVPLSPASANVIWIPPSQPNGVITEYNVIYSIYGDTEMHTNNTVPGDETSFIIIDLGKQGYSQVLFVSGFSSKSLMSVVHTAF